MAFENEDVRIVLGDVDEVSDGICAHLKSIGYITVPGSNKNYSSSFHAVNKERSAIKLFLSATPQIVQFHIDEKPDERVQVEITYNLFTRFRLFYYSVISSLMVIFIALIKLSDNEEAYLSADGFLHSLSLSLVGAGLLILAMFFMCRMLDTGPYELFVKKLFSNFTGVSVLRSGCGFPDLWGALAVFVGFLVVFIISTDFLSVIYEMMSSGYIFLSVAFVILGILVLLLVVMLLKSVAVTRLLFCLLGISLCLPAAILGNAPAANVIISDVIEKVEIVNKRSEEILADKTIEAGSLNYKLAQLQKTKQAGLLIANFYWIAFLLIVLFLAWNALRLPIIITRQQEKFLTKHEDSVYHQALQPEEKSLLFDFAVILLWVVMTVANFAGLYFSLYVFERVVFGENYLLGTSIGNTFFENTRTIISMTFNFENSVLYHNIAMLVYSLPLVLIFFLVLAKNLITFLKTVFRLRSSVKLSDVEKELLRMVQEICSEAAVRVPIVRVTNSQKIEASTEYLGFPFFKNIMLVTKGAWKEVSDKEGELYALLSHEVFHQKRHTLKRRILCFLSDYSFFGNGFLALLQNSYHVEREADAFSVDILTSKYKSRDKAVEIFSSLLERERSFNATTTHKHNVLGGGFSFAGSKDDAYRKKLLDSFDASSKIKRAWINIYLLFQIYFGDEVLSYFHPTVEVRKEWIKE